MNLTQLFGIHAVQAALDYSPQKIRRAWVDSQRQDVRLKQVIDDLVKLGINPEKTERKKLEKMADGKNHQGIVVAVELPAMRSEDQLKQDVEALTQTPFYLVLDQVQDPHNLGACLRTADAVGAHGVIVTKDNAAGITPTVCKVASGAAETVPVYQVTNLARVLRWLKEQNIWIMGAAGEAEQTVFQMELDMPLAVVMGTEGTGMRHLTRQHCDFLVKIPMAGQVESLNVSVAAGVLLYEVFRQKLLA
ncbi:23S rRNA (guanosine(2251)-2'-O)-methyltransferase RlmB [Methylomonas sp. LW13]|uniref:23S rRNA (guanosine-2'-O-)-methyltransferase RlmB n=1 Tax=Methylomonas defluvii TaxID=3045149 RepID=A0ABU4UG38_9GAMM|nr:MULTISPECIES: 23S rRNA (guanosine(2251)-2'-O)-methyltransferase RlmB [unclassified Methylomonas]MDX8128358.1 23S rRNA (guanosine(2251)-2'-O)-methyltransferase RlmB [Methylomonas sp. OY6]PKD38050.1 23S rRNA (guanosine(2251)-2'-O)-methyltransferase RlmB [Methylomonas sp. Kb3]QBC28200.1 23S rRNA (guanosine(2251)-2'-O)-methyltransferase RlmB [Methylomonas sp. LW13]